MMKKKILSRILCLISLFAVVFTNIHVFADDSYTGLFEDDMVNADQIYEAETYETGNNGYYVVFKFIPEHTAEYRIWTSGRNCDPELYLYNSLGEIETCNDDYTDNTLNYNARITETLYSNETYYIKAAMHAGNPLVNYELRIGRFEIHEEVSYDRVHITDSNAYDVPRNRDFTITYTFTDTIHSEDEIENVSITWYKRYYTDGGWNNPTIDNQPNSTSYSENITDKNIYRAFYDIKLVFPDGYVYTESCYFHLFDYLTFCDPSPSTFNYLVPEGQDAHIHVDVTAEGESEPLAYPDIQGWRYHTLGSDGSIYSRTPDLTIPPQTQVTSDCNIDGVDSINVNNLYSDLSFSISIFPYNESRVISLEPGRQYHVSDYVGGDDNVNSVIFSFTPDVSGNYTFSSNGAHSVNRFGSNVQDDPYAALFDSSFICLACNDDSAITNECGVNAIFGPWFRYNFTESVPDDDLNFKLTYDLTAGHTYYYAVPIDRTYFARYYGCDYNVILTYNNPASDNDNSSNNNNNSNNANVDPNPGSSEPTPTPAIPQRSPSAPAVVREPGVAGFVERLYTVALERPSDPAGKQDWIDAITLRGETGASCARGFLYSPEFLNKGLSDEEFVAVLYRTFFDREPDQAGFNAWVGVLRSGTSKEEVIEGFINSTEWANLCLFYGIRSGGTGVPSIEMEPNQQTINFATRLYTTCLGRSADQAGLMAWARQLANQRDTGTGAAHGFFFSSEFTGQNVSNGEFVRRLYLTFMDREPDQAGFDAWVAQLNSGVSREEVFNGFSQSIEFARICASYGIVR